MNSIARNKASDMAASAAKPVSIVVSAIVTVEVDVRMRGACVEISVDVVRLSSVMIE